MFGLVTLLLTLTTQIHSLLPENWIVNICNKDIQNIHSKRKEEKRTKQDA